MYFKKILNAGLVLIFSLGLNSRVVNSYPDSPSLSLPSLSLPLRMNRGDSKGVG